MADLPNQCDANVASTSDVTCSFAENTFYEYYKSTGGNPTQAATLQAWSPPTHQYYSETCSSGDGVVDCVHGSGSDVRFNRSAVSAYSDSQASAYAQSHDLGPSG